MTSSFGRSAPSEDGVGFRVGRTKRIQSGFLIVLLLSGILAISGLPAMSIISHAQQAPADNPLPTGLPSYASLVTQGNNFASLIQSSPEYKSLANGAAFYIDPHSSYGFSAGPAKQDDYEIITFFSFNRESYITADVNNETAAIMDISLTNLNSTAVIFSSSNNWSGYAAPDCAGSLFGSCYSFNSVFKAYGDIQAPSSVSAPATENKCCSFAEWTGIGEDSSGTGMSQGGWVYSGFQLSALPHANSEGYTLFVEDIYDGHAPAYYAPPSWMNGVAGQTITLTTESNTLCSFNPIMNEWFEIWQLGSSSMEQEISCISNGVAHTWGYYILESPALSQCSGGWNNFCQLPNFGTLDFTRNICTSLSSCEDINSNNNTGLVGYFITHNTQDTTTSGIPANGNSWTETWDSPGT